MKKIIIPAIVLFITITCVNAYAQVTASISATATVLTGISVTNKSDLNFGNDIVPGILRTIDKTNANSGRFTLIGAPNKQISISFVTPSQLINGANTMPITFTSTDAGYQVPGGSVISFNPVVVSNASFNSQGTMTVYLGGKVTPSSNQESGLYTASITVNLEYTGN
ncbi:MAG: DUF4402 domain-containing protein [Candidatus Kapaibacterium sp.]